MSVKNVLKVPQDQSSPTVLQCNGMLPAPKQAQNMYVKRQYTKKLIDKTETRLKGHHDSWLCLPMRCLVLNPKFSKLFKRTPNDQENGFLESGRMCTIKLGAIALQPVSNLQNFFMPSPRKIGACTMTSWKCVHLQVIISMGCLLGYHPYHQSN
jgi:hypothetical protein